MTKKRNSYEIVVDFDGTCVKHQFPEIGDDVPGARLVLKELVAAGHKLILFTMRSDGQQKGKFEDGYEIHPGDYLSQAAEWFSRNGIELWGIQTNPTQSRWTTSPKAYGQIYIDDAALGCPLVYPTDTNERPWVDWAMVRLLLNRKGVL